MVRRSVPVGSQASSRARVLASRVRSLTIAFFATAGLVAAPIATAIAHPLHTTLTDVTIDPRDGSARIVVRAFIDDFSDAASRHAGRGVGPDHSVSDDVLRNYVTAKMAVLDARGQRVSLSWEGVRRQGDLLWITMRASTVQSLRGVRLGSALLFDKFDDQVNIVQVSEGSAHRSMLFTSGDGGKAKPLF